jgi:hypothetical protein
MKNYPEILFSNRKKIVLFIFFLALIVRLLLILTNHTKNKITDLNIYRETGQLVKSGVNPYIFTEDTEVRNKLRLDTIAYDPFVSETQEAWDYYTSSNLPMSSLHYGLIDKITNSNPVAFRIIFSFFDSVLSVITALFLIKYWQLTSTWLNLILVLGAAALSPTLLLWGSIVPEDKGLQTLFMLSAVWLAKDKKWILSSVMLGISVAYKGLGIFISPLCLFFIIGQPENIFRINSSQLKKGVIYTLLSLFFATIWFLPYMPDVLTMMQGRLSLNLDVEPGHGSIWTFVLKVFPGNWVFIKTTLIIVISLIWSYTFIFKKINIPAFSLFLLVLFVDIMLLQGSLDRMNIGIMVSMILFCYIDIKYCRTLVWYTIIAGWPLYIKSLITGNPDETIDGLFTIGYLIIFSLYPIYYLYKTKSSPMQYSNAS